MTETSRKLPTRSKHVPWMIIALILAVMAGTLSIITLKLRTVLRAQIIQQDGIMLYAASMVPTTIADDISPEDADDPEFVFVVLTDKVFAASQQKGVLDVRVFDHEGKEWAGGTNELSARELETMRAFETISSFDANAKVRVPENELIQSPLIRALVPLKQKEKFVGAAEFLLDGRKVADELRKLDKNMWLYSVIMFFIGGGIMAGALWWAFGRLQRTMGLLEDRTKSLLRANHELSLAAKTSAVGAITAHLIHDLKNPLFGLQSFVSARGSADEEDWNIARDTTQRMQKVIGEIVRILREEKTTENYELSIDEVLSLLRSKLEPECEQAGLTFRTAGTITGSLMNRDGNIILLVITNLVHNAIHATPRGGEITVQVSAEEGHAVFDIRDSGPGLPEHILTTLFTPSRSSKSGGTGLGLAISKQLANHIGAELVLKKTSKSGTVFQLRVPERILAAELAAP